MPGLGTLISVYCGLCATQGAAGIPAPGIVDFQHLPLIGHSEAIAAPPGYAGPLTLASPVYKIAPAGLFAAAQSALAALPNATPLDTITPRLQAAWVFRSATFNFPDVFELAVVPAAGGSALYIYSHALYGYGDYGVNAKHIETLFASLNQKVPR